MLKSKIKYMLIIALLLACGVETFGQTVVPATKQEVDKLVAVIKSNAEIKEKMDACRLLSIVGTTDAVAPLVALLGDELAGDVGMALRDPDDVATVTSESKPNSRSGEERWKKCSALDCMTCP